MGMMEGRTRAEYSSDSQEGQLLANDPAAFDRVSRWIAIVLASPRFRMLRADWMDLHQEAMARVVESLRRGQFDATRDFRVYVQGVARHTALQAITRRMSEGLADGGAGADCAGAGDAEHELASRLTVRHVLESASPECRRLMRLYFFEHLTYEEIASLMAIPVGTVKSRLFRCLECAARDARGERRRRPREVSRRASADDRGRIDEAAEREAD